MFLSVQRKFASQDGATLFVRGALMEQAVKLGTDRSEEPAGKPAADVHPAPATPGSEDSEKAESGLKHQVVKAIMKAGLAKFPLDGKLERSCAMDGSAAGGRKGWQVQSWMALKDQPKGVWRLAGQGTARTPQIAGRLPKRGHTYVWGSGRDPARLYQDILEELSRDLPPDQMSWVRAGIGAAEGKVGLSLPTISCPRCPEEWCFSRGVQNSPGSQEGAGDGSPSKAAFFIILRSPALRGPGDPEARAAAQIESPGFERRAGLERGRGRQCPEPGGIGRDGDPHEQSGLGTGQGGSPGKSWEALSEYRDKACLLAVADPLGRPSPPMFS